MKTTVLQDNDDIIPTNQIYDPFVNWDIPPRGEGSAAENNKFIPFQKTHNSLVVIQTVFTDTSHDKLF